jgi:hypothetical protein
MNKMKSQEMRLTFFMARGLTRMQRICADYLFNPPYKSYRLTVLTSFYLLTND